MTENKLTDEKLFQLCKRYGHQALDARRKFTGLLPEVYRRRLYEKKGHSSIFEFAAKLAGMSNEHVRRVLNLEKKFRDKPALHMALVQGEVSAHKLARVASIATPENQDDLADKAKILSQPALETLVRDEKQNGLFKAGNNGKSVRPHTYSQDSLPDVNLLDHLSLDLQKNLITRLKKGIDLNKLLSGLLEKHDKELLEEKNRLTAEENERAEKRLQESKKAPRTIRINIKKYLQKVHGTKCSMRNCEKQIAANHHTQRFALSKTHDPHYLAPLCRDHHQIAHSIDQKYQRYQKMRI